MKTDEQQPKNFCLEIFEWYIDRRGRVHHIDYKKSNNTFTKMEDKSITWYPNGEVAVFNADSGLTFNKDDPSYHREADLIRKLTSEEASWLIELQSKTTSKISKGESVDHPQHYGGADNPYEAIKVIEAWGLGFCDGNVVKYLSRWRDKGGVEDLKKARWYLDRFIQQELANAEKVKKG